MKRRTSKSIQKIKGQDYKSTSTSPSEERW